MGLKINTVKGAKVTAASEFDKHLSAKPATGTVTIVKGKTNPDGTKDEKVILDVTETVHKGVVLETSKMGMLSVGGGSTINLGNFEFARVDVKLEFPTTKEDLEETFTFISEWVGAKIEQAVNSAKE